MFARIIALVTKEFLALLKDKRSRLVLIVPPLLQLMVFGYAFREGHHPCRRGMLLRRHPPHAFLAGDVWSVILPNALGLVVLATVFLGLTWRNARKRLE